VAVPSHLTPAIDLCLDGLENLRRSPEAIYGYSAALASLLGAVRYPIYHKNDYYLNSHEFKSNILLIFSDLLPLVFLILVGRLFSMLEKSY
jgi:hypothetical protein